VLSILAGKTIAGIKGALPGSQAVVRAMPNLAASIGRGATGAYASPGASVRQRAMAGALLAGNGLVEWVGSEDLIDAVTAVSGSGPAYVFHLVECLAQAGIAAGLEAEVARRLAQATVEGAGELMRTSGLDPAILRRNVTSPGGTTAAALEVLMAEDGLGPLMCRAVEAAKRRAGELAG
jgi:pyrroline-5-carboxylate reductase